MDTIVCHRCRISKPLDAFGKGKTRKPGRAPCLQCRREMHAAKRAAQPVPEPKTTKRCARCKEEKSLDDFQAVLNKKTSQVIRISYCKSCRSTMRSEDWQTRKENDPEGLQEYMHARAVKYVEYNTEYSKTHRPQINANKAKNKAENLDEHQAYQRQWANEKYATDEEFRLKRLATNKRWEHDNPELVKQKRIRHRSRKDGADIVDLTHDQFLEICQAFNYRCAYCPPDCVECRKKTHRLEQEHITSTVNGGNYTVQNIVPSCRSCNAKKNTNPAPVFVQPLLLTVAPSRKKKP